MLLRKVLRGRGDIYKCLASKGPPKKRKIQTAEVLGDRDVINIMKDGTDPKIYPSEMYPPWLISMARDIHFSPEDTFFQMFYGQRVPTGREQFRIAKSLKKSWIKDDYRRSKEFDSYLSDEESDELLAKEGLGEMMATDLDMDEIKLIDAQFTDLDPQEEDSNEKVTEKTSTEKASTRGKGAKAESDYEDK